jgi:hypothetical protein
MRDICKKNTHIRKEHPAKSQQSSHYELSLFLNRRVIAYIGWMSRVCRDGDDKEGWKKAEERLSGGRQLYRTAMALLGAGACPISFVLSASPP